MEEESNNGNVFQAEFKANGRKWKPPTRLQSQAPPCLQLDQTIVMASASAEAFLCSDDTPKAIPYLSPLVLSPQPLPETRICGRDDDDNGQRQCDGNVNNVVVVVDKTDDDAVSPQSGWQHPAVAPFADPSSLFSFFQSQCIIANQAQ